MFICVESTNTNPVKANAKMVAPPPTGGARAAPRRGEVRAERAWKFQAEQKHLNS